MIKVKNENSRKKCIGSCLFSILGVMGILAGLFAFSQLSSESYQEHHSGWVESVGLTVFSALFVIFGVVITFAGLFIRSDKKADGASSSGCLSIFGWLFIVIALGIYANNWSWQRLKDYANNVVYAEFPKHFLYDKSGEYDFPISFYQYRPSMAGNHKKYYLDLAPDQYYLSIHAKDSSGEQSVRLINQQLHINNDGDYLLTVEVTDKPESPYRIQREFPYHDLLLQHAKNANTNTWVKVSEADIPELLQQSAKIRAASFGYRRVVEMTQLNDEFYFEEGLHFFKTPFNQDEKIRLKLRPQTLLNSFFYGYQGLIYSFGGRLFQSEEQPGNWVYSPKKNEWRALSAFPLSITKDNKHEVKVVAVYSIAKKLFVMLQAKEHVLYQFDITAKQQWKMVKEFSVSDAQENWQYLNNKTLVTFIRQKFNQNKDGVLFLNGHLKTFDLETYQIKTVSTTSKLIVYGSDFFNLHPYKKELYLYSGGRFYFLNQEKLL